MNTCIIPKFISETYNSARAVEKVVSEMSTSNDENLIIPIIEKQKRLIKKRKFYGDTSSNEGNYACRGNILLVIVQNTNVICKIV